MELVPFARYVPFTKHYEGNGCLCGCRWVDMPLTNSFQGDGFRWVEWPHYIGEVLLVDNDDLSFLNMKEMEDIIKDLHFNFLNAKTDEERDQAGDEYLKWYKASCAAMHYASLKNTELRD